MMTATLDDNKLDSLSFRSNFSYQITLSTHKERLTIKTRYLNLLDNLFDLNLK